MLKKKNDWVAPRLIVLTRGKPEERVLEACKDITPGGTQGWGTGNCTSKSKITYPECGTIGPS